MAAPGTTKAILRSLKHLEPTPKGAKFARKTPSHALHKPKFVQVKDRIPYWNIVPGDHVRLRSGRVGQKEGLDDENGAKIRGEGIVLSIDRDKNWLWLRDVDEANKLAPKALRHIVPRLVDPADPSKGFGPNVAEVPRPVHYSNVMLKVPGSDQYAVRLSRSRVKYNRGKGMFVWKRFATVKLPAKKAAETGQAFEKVEVPWPSLPGKKRLGGPLLTDSFTVENESWAPWRPEDPVFLPNSKHATSPESEHRAKLLRAERGRLDHEKRASGKYALPPGADGSYAGFKQDRLKPPPVAQPPTPAEMVRAQRAETAAWASDKAIESHREQGGLAFAASDYLDIAPRSGPASGGNWAELPSIVPRGGLDGERNPTSGKLVYGVGRNDLDRMPIELMMQSELANEYGLKWRMRRWQEKKEIDKQKALEAARLRKELEKELEVLKL